MSSKGKSGIDGIEIEEDEVKLNEKPTWDHLEKSAEKTTEKPYWDTKDVVGADRYRDSEQSDVLEEKQKVSPGFWRRRWLHYRKYWKLYTVLAIVLLAAGLPILFLVIFPAIAQRLVDNASLPIHSASIMNPTPDSVVYSMSATLKVPAGVTVDLKPISLSLFTNTSEPSDPYIKVDLPEYHLKGTSDIIITNQTATILNQAEFEDFLTNAIDSKEFALEAAGSTAAYLGVLKAPIKFNKKVTLYGLNSVTGFAFNDAAIVFPAEADGTNLEGSVNLPNPSVVSFELGNVTLNMIVGGIIIGSGRLYDVLLVPGNNTVPIQATVDIKTFIQNLPAILQTEAKSLVSGNVLISATGNSTVYNGVHIPYYEDVLNNLHLTGEMPLVQILINTLEQYLGSNSSLLNNILGAFNGTSILTSLLDGLQSGNGTNSLASLLNGLANDTSTGSLLSSLGL